MAGYGFLPAYHAGGGTIRLTEYPILSTYAANIFTGDTVILHTDGTLNVGTASTTTHVGVFAGCQYVDADGNMVFKRYWPTGVTATDPKGYVWDDYSIVFKCQADQVSTALLSTDVGDGFDVVATAGSTVTGSSGFVLNSDAKSVDTFRLVGSAQLDKGYTAAGTTMDVYVRFLDHLHLSLATVS